MLSYFFSLKFIVLYIFIGSVIYTHFRGKVRNKFFYRFFEHSFFLAPVNVFMYLFSAVPNQPFLDIKQFPELVNLRENWEIIRDEARQLFQTGQIKASEKHDDAAFNPFFKRGWKRFYLKWYGADCLPSAQSLCPKTTALLRSTPLINAAMFALLPKHAQLNLHRDPYAGSLRYHLGLITPNSEACCIYVDGIQFVWRDGEDVLFDETYLHRAENKTEQDRIILFCDVKRPLKNKFATKINAWFSRYVVGAAAAKNLPEDPIGLINKIYKYPYQLHLVTRKLKAANKPFYYFVKYTLTALIIYWIFFR